MSSSIKQKIVTFFFVLLLGVAWFLGRTPAQEDPFEGEKALTRYGFYLRESHEKAGIDFIHHGPVLDHSLDHIMPILAAMGAGVSVVDFDRDGLLDFYVVTGEKGGKNRLYKNMGNGTFRDVAEEMGLADLNQEGTGACMGAVWGDFDNDGFEDLLVYKWGRPELFHNDQGNGFTRVTDKAGLPRWVNANSAIWVDYDRDGHLDLFIAGYWDEKLDLFHLDSTEIMPESFEYAKNGGRKYLLRNKGDGTFEDVTEKVGITSRRWTLAVGAADLCGTGYPDLFLANDYGVSEVYANHGGKEFKEIGQYGDIGKHPKSGMNVSFGDFANLGSLGIYVSNITQPGVLPQGNNLWVTRGSGDELSFENRAASLNVQMGGWSWGAQFGDLNNDGFLDLYLTNGYISASRTESFWYDYGLIAGALGKLIKDARNWPAIRDRSLSGYQTKCLWWNRGGQFVDICTTVGVNDTFDGRAVALADFGNHGVLDVLVANQNGPLLLYRNAVSGDNDWIQFDLEGTKSNRSAIGARVVLHWKNEARPEGQIQVQEVSGGQGYAAQNMRRLHFGLGKNVQIEKAVIRWPSGLIQTVLAPKINTLHKLLEPTK